MKIYPIKYGDEYVKYYCYTPSVYIYLQLFPLVSVFEKRQESRTFKMLLQIRLRL